MRKDFVANASHELRSPLTVISGYLETLSQDPMLDRGPAGTRRGDAPPGRAHDRHHHATCWSCRGWRQRRTRSSRRAGGRGGADVACCARTCWRVPSTRREVRVRVESDAHAHRATSPRSIRRSPTWSTTPPSTPRADGSIEIRWWVDEEGGHFSVTDTGIGIHADHIPRLTERFYRVDAGRARDTGGSGLGLAIVKHVLQRHGATLEIDSAQGRGSTFTCHFPPTSACSAAGPGLGERSATA